LYLLCFNVPETHLEIVKNAVFGTGAGSVSNYAHCAWQTLGEGQFIPLPGNNAFIGETNKLEKVPEYKVEIICTPEQINSAVTALKQSHPYEEPCYYVLRLEEF
jgi:structural hemagglutinin/hemolysin toxin protein RtxA